MSRQRSAISTATPSLDIAYDPDTGIARKVVARRAVVRQHLANASRARVEQLRPREKMSERSEGLTASGTIAKIDAEHGALALSTHGQVILELRVSDRSRLFLNGEEVRSLRRFDRGFVAKALFTRTQDGNIVEELHAHGRVAAHDAARPRQPVEDDRAKMQELRASLAIHAKNRPVAGGAGWSWWSPSSAGPCLGRRSTSTEGPSARPITRGRSPSLYRRESTVSA